MPGINGEKLILLLNLGEATHVRHENLRNCDASVLVLVILEDCRHRAADRKARTVQRIAKTRALEVLRVFIANTSAACLEIRAAGARGDLFIILVAWHPNFNVVSLRGREAHITSAKRDYAVWQIQKLQNVFRGVCHFLELVKACLWSANFYHFNFAELMHADNAARVAAS